MMSSQLKLRGHIQALRGLSVLGVICFHINEKVFSLGYLGVDVFFVMSGFVIVPKLIYLSESYSVQSYVKQIIRFYIRRFWRLFPALIFTVMITLLLVGISIPTDTFTLISRQAIFAIFMLGNFGAYNVVGNYFHNLGSPLLHIWSLGVEEQIYLLLPIFLLLSYAVIPIRNKKNSIRIPIYFISSFSLSLFIFSDLNSSFYHFLGIQDAKNLSFYSPINRFWEFGAGGLLAIYSLSSWTIKWKGSKQYAWIVSLIILIPTPFLGATASTLVFVTASLVFLKFGSFESPKTDMGRILIWIGDRSYSIYLIHLPLIFVVKNSPYLATTNEVLGVSILGLTGFLSIFLGGKIYKVVESQFQNFSYVSSLLKNNFQVTRVSLWVGITGIVILLMSIGASSSYWGLSSTPKIPKVGWELDSKCSSMSYPPLGACVYEESENRKSVLLIGDSHAAQFSDVLRRVASQEKWNAAIWTMAGCAVVFEASSPQISEECLARNLEIYNWIKINKPNLVIVSQYNGDFLSRRSVETALLSIKSLVKGVLLIGNTPVFPDTRYMQTTTLLGPLYKAPTSFQRSKMDLNNEPYSNKLMKWAREADIDTVNLNSLWCNNKRCIRNSRGQWLWSDRDHLSSAGALLSKPMFEHYLRSYGDK